jgi:AcrR family transcriptional regulator
MTAPGARPTRQRLLEAGQQEVYLHGFQGTSLGAILQRAGATKGAFFHYFATKKVFGYAIVDEVLAQLITAQWVTPLHGSRDPLETISAEFERGIEALKIQRPILGCPLNNLAQEMNPLDAGFRNRTTRVFQTWQQAYRSALARAQQHRTVLAALDPGDAAYLLVAQIEGILSLARNTQDPATLDVGARALRGYLTSIRAQAADRGDHSTPAT